MKVITVTEKNIKEVYGRLNKFFNNRNKNGYVEWHNFDCGFKKRINPYIFIDGQKIRTDNIYTSYAHVEMDTMHGRTFIRMKLSYTDAGIIEVGDKIAFLGNRFIHREKFTLSKHKYIYSTYQMIPMTDKEHYVRNVCNKAQAKAEEDDFYED